MICASRSKSRGNAVVELLSPASLWYATLGVVCSLMPILFLNCIHGRCYLVVVMVG